MSLRGLLVVVAGCAPVIQEDGSEETGRVDDTGAPDTDTDTDTDADVVPDGSCGMSDDLASSFWSEGDTVSFTLSCDSGRHGLATGRSGPDARGSRRASPTLR